MLSTDEGPFRVQLRLLQTALRPHLAPRNTQRFLYCRASLSPKTWKDSFVTGDNLFFTKSITLSDEGRSGAFRGYRACTMTARTVAQPGHRPPLSFCLNSWPPVTFHPNPSNHFRACVSPKQGLPGLDKEMCHRQARGSKMPVSPFADDEIQRRMVPEEDMLQFCQRSIMCPLPMIHC